MEYIIVIFLLGLIIGSFLNVVAYRLPIMLSQQWQKDYKSFQSEPLFNTPSKTMNLALPQSHCPSCDGALKWWHNIPLLSYILLQGKCYFCQTRISLRYPLIELLSALCSAIILWKFGLTLTAAFSLIFTWVLITGSVIDYHHKILPDNLTLPLLWLGLLVAYLGYSIPIDDAVLGAMLGYSSLWLLFWGFKIITKKNGMGYGDFKLLAALGAWLGWQALPQVLLIASILALFIALTGFILKRSDLKEKIPFGPYLAFAGWWELCNLTSPLLHYLQIG